MGPGGPGSGNGGGPFSGSKNQGAEVVVQKFYERLMGGEANNAAELFSAKAVGKAKQLREGKAPDAMIEELKALFANMKLASTQPKAMQGMHVVLFEESNSAAQSTPSGKPKKKLGKKLQFKVLSEGGNFLIQDIR
jgi:hypothetical protein